MEGWDRRWRVGEEEREGEGRRREWI